MYFQLHGFKKCKSDPNLYAKKVKDDIIIVAVYIDDLLIAGPNISLMNDLKSDLKGAFYMSDLGELSYFLGLQISRLHDGLFISQKKYDVDLLEKFNMLECKSAPTPFQSGSKLTKECISKKVDATLYRQLVGTLVYLTHFRPDICFAVNLVSRFM